MDCAKTRCRRPEAYHSVRRVSVRPAATGNRNYRFTPLLETRPKAVFHKARRKIRSALLCLKIRKMVGATGFEPATSCSQSKRATMLRHAPNSVNIPQYGEFYQQLTTCNGGPAIWSFRPHPSRQPCAFCGRAD
jgi:hypothetical protein